jgi:LysM repeat protein
MAHRSPARWLAPLALAVFVIALVSVVNSSTDGGGPANDTSAPATTQGSGAGEEGAGGKRERRRRTYVVKLGDTPSQIAAETGVSLDQLEKLNPDLDPQLLAPGEKIRIRP